jgi:hypothetical protein
LEAQVGEKDVVVVVGLTRAGNTRDGAYDHKADHRSLNMADHIRMHQKQRDLVSRGVDPADANNRGAQYARQARESNFSVLRGGESLYQSVKKRVTGTR